VNAAEARDKLSAAEALGNDVLADYHRVRLGQYERGCNGPVPPIEQWAVDFIASSAAGKRLMKPEKILATVNK
jgi:hypothetical protein